MITIRNKCDYDNELLIMTSESTYLEDKLEFFMRFLIAIGHDFENGSDLVILGKDEMVWTDEEIEQLKKETIEEYIEDNKSINGVTFRDINGTTTLSIENEDNILPGTTCPEFNLKVKDNYMDEAPF